MWMRARRSGPASSRFLPSSAAGLEISCSQCRPSAPRPPPRAADVPAIIGQLVRDLCRPLASRARGFEAPAIARLAAEPWPRNIDSLRQRVAALMLASESEWIGAEQVVEQLAGSTSAGANQGPALARALTAP